MFSREWWHFVRPWLFVAVLITTATVLAYSNGAGVWVVYLGVAVGTLALLPGHERWENRQR
jgi:hypothetical protein